MDRNKSRLHLEVTGPDCPVFGRVDQGCQDVKVLSHLHRQGVILEL